MSRRQSSFWFLPTWKFGCYGNENGKIVTRTSEFWDNPKATSIQPSLMKFGVHMVLLYIVWSCSTWSIFKHNLNVVEVNILSWRSHYKRDLYHIHKVLLSFHHVTLTPYDNNHTWPIFHRGECSDQDTFRLHNIYGLYRQYNVLLLFDLDPNISTWPIFLRGEHSDQVSWR